MTHSPKQPSNGSDQRMLRPSAIQRRLKVLIVEDELESAALLGELIARLGHEPLTAHTGGRAIELVVEEVPDVVLLDLALPDMTGFELAAAIRARRAADPCRIVALTGFGGEGEREKARRAGCDGFLTKPLRIPDLVALFEESSLCGPRARVH